MTKFNKGDNVTVIDSMRTFDTYEQYVVHYAPKYSQLFHRKGLPKENQRYSVVYTGKHDSFKDILCIIVNKEETEVYVVNEEGLEKAEFVKGDKVVITDCNGLWGSHNGDKGIIEDIGEAIVGVRMNDGHYEAARKFQVALDTEDSLTKTEALKAALDGQKVQCDHWSKTVEGDDEPYVYFDGKDFMWHGFDGHNQKAIGVLNYKDSWTILAEPVTPPRFSKDSLFTTSTGKLGKVTDDPVLDSGSWKYHVRFARANTVIQGFKEAEMYEVEL